MHIVQVNYAYDPAIPDPDETLRAWPTLTGWSKALINAGAASVTTVIRFCRSADLSLDGARYIFYSGGGMPFPWGSVWTGGFNRKVLSLRPDLVHVNGLIFPFQLLWLRQVLPLDAVVIAQDHGGVDPSSFGMLRRFLSRLFLNADGFLFSSLEQAQPWREAGLIPSHSVVFPIMEASTDMGREPASGVAARPRLPGRPAILWAGRLNKNKDLLTVPHGSEKALKCVPEARLTMVYQTVELLRLVQAAIDASPALHGRVHLRGRVPHEEMACLYSGADMLVLGSRREGSGYALIEAMACGVVPVVSDIPSFRVLTDGGRLGALCKAGDAGEFAEAIIRIAHSNLGKLSAEISAYFERNLSWNAIGRRALEFYEEMIRLRRRS